MLHNFRSIENLYDFLYLGRKLGKDWASETKIGNDFVEPHYSYWTVGYLLTGNGIEKLLKSNPLRRLLPVDEYLPLMFGVHSNQSLIKLFSDYGPYEKVNSLSVSPLIIKPTHFVGDSKYISDTEHSLKIVNEENKQIMTQIHKSFDHDNENDNVFDEEFDDDEDDNVSIDDNIKITPVLVPPPQSNSHSHFEF